MVFYPNKFIGVTIMMKIFFLVVVLVVLSFMSIYTYRRFFLKITFLKPYGVWIRNLFLLALIMIGVYFYLRGFDSLGQVGHIVLTSALGVMFMLFAVALVYDLGHISFKNVPFQQSRRQFIKIAYDVTFLILAISYLFKGFVNGLKAPVLTKVSIMIEGWKKKGYKIIQLSDVHVGNTIKKEFVKELVKRINAQNPDMVVITGDLVDLTVEEIKEDLAPLKNLISTHGTFFVLGNHEYFHGAYAWIEHLETLGIKVLLNESIMIDGKFNLVGVNDYFGYRAGYLEPDVKKAFENVDERYPTIVLAHQPKMIKELRAYKPDLMLSGHTHGGQIFPFGLLVLLDQPYLAGLYHDSGTQVFVSKGTGFWGPAIRVLAESEIVEITIN